MLQNAAEPELLTVREAAELLKVSPDTIRRRVAAAELPAYRTGSGPRCPLRIKAGDLDSYIFGEDECHD
jgi:excisionase family DNA binding protein